MGKAISVVRNELGSSADTTTVLFTVTTALNTSTLNSPAVAMSELENIEAVMHPISARTNGDGKYKTPHVNEETYKKMHAESIQDPAGFFGRMADELLTFHTPYKTVNHGGFEAGDNQWFPEGSECERTASEKRPLMNDLQPSTPPTTV